MAALVIEPLDLKVVYCILIGKSQFLGQIEVATLVPVVEIDVLVAVAAAQE